ncbi:MAG: hypothetical protein A6F72_02175 [Cycloclasticus sp. symbiont of Poecilosclerida sp. N]|nr:MAG: hypothetical protein A6F72_02175 [Cycloclasticus sp. symbiont of Poecilosclerida sp. N]
MKIYTHLTEAHRYHIYLMKKQGFSLRFTAKTMNRSTSTINHEIKRNTGKKSYRPKQANEFAQQRHRQKNKHIRLTAEIMGYIREKLKEYWSPEQIVARLELDKKVKISTETAYRVDIDKRPSIVDTRSRPGGWELDWLKEMPSTSLQQTLRYLDKALKRF